MSAKACGVEREWHAAGDRQFADLESDALGLRPLEPGGHLLLGRGSHERVVERAPVPLEQRSVPARDPDQDGARPVDRARLVLLHAKRQHLAEPDLAAGVDRHVTAGLELEPVQ